MPKDAKSLPEMEEEILSFWKREKIFQKSVEKNPIENSYVFYDGPPFISGLPHYGHLLCSIAKDVIPRYWTMRGKRVERVWGWDAHGLTVENKVQARLGIKNRRDIESFGLEKFTQECYKYTKEVSAEWGWYIDRIGRWVDFENAYKTIDQTYMESVMWVFKSLYEKGLIYEGVRTSLYCVTCGTPVSNFEVAMDNSYKEEQDPSIIVKFKIKDSDKFENSFILAWTTTPWTIPSNRALVVDPKESYVLFKSLGGENCVVAEKRLGFVKEKVAEVIYTFGGEYLLGLSYEPPYTFYSHKKGEFKVYEFENMVSMEEGTGIVHCAPGFGDVDTQMGRYYGLTIMQTVDEEGKFIEGDAGTNPFAGLFYLKANEKIIEDLLLRKLLFSNEKIIHRVPYHDRCNTLLIQRAQNSWFINIQTLKDSLIKNNEDINWVPDHIKEGRFKLGILQAPDWCISRNRFWATPMPVWESEDGDRVVIGSIKELEELSGQRVKDLHRPYIDEITFTLNGKVFRRRSEVLDSWLEAGSMPYAQVHYPFENKEKFERSFPGDWIVEYIAQVRAWFYVMHVLSTALFGTKSFRNVICTGTLAGSDGRKMSKTYGNYTDPKEVLQKYGGDALRLYFLGSPLMVGENANFNELDIKNKLHRTLNPLWNSYKFFETYAFYYGWKVESRNLGSNKLDLWIRLRLAETIKQISQSLESYTTPPAVRALEDFVDDLSRWYVRRSRERVSNGDKEALSCLYEVLFYFVHAVAPIIPFLAESIYKGLQVFDTSLSEESIHLRSFLDYDFSLEEGKKILDDMSSAMRVSSFILSARAEAKIAVRQPLANVKIYNMPKLSDFYEQLIMQEVNVKSLVWLTDESNEFRIELDTSLTEELKVEGWAREMIRSFQDLRKEKGLVVGQKIEATYPQTLENEKAVQALGEEIKNKIGATVLKPGSEFSISLVS